MRFLSGKEKKELKDKLPKGYCIEKKDEIKQEEDILYKNNEKYLIFFEEKYFPHIKTIDENNYKKVFIDNGAVKFIAKGADLMRPGIEEIEEGFETGDIVIIKNKNINKILALGISLYSSNEVKELNTGKVIKIFHYIGDKYY